MVRKGATSSFRSRLLARVFSSKKKGNKLFAKTDNPSSSERFEEETKKAADEISNDSDDPNPQELEEELPWKIEIEDVSKQEVLPRGAEFLQQSSSTTKLWRKGHKHWRTRSAVAASGDGEEVESDNESDTHEHADKDDEYQHQQKTTLLLRESATTGARLRRLAGAVAANKKNNGITWRATSTIEDLDQVKKEDKSTTMAAKKSISSTKKKQQEPTTRVGCILTWMEHDRVHAARALASLCCNESLDEANKGAIRKAIPDLISMLKEPSESAVAAQCLRNMAVDPQLRPAVTPAIVPLLSLLHTENAAQGRDEAAAALNNLSICADIQTELLPHVPTLLHVLKSSPDDCVVEWTAAVLANLAAKSSGRSAVVRAGAIPHLTALLIDWPSTTKLQAARALKNIAWSNFEYCALVATSGAIPLLLSLLDLNPRHRTLGDDVACIEALLALHNLASKNADIQQIMVDAGAVPTVSRLLASSSSNTTSSSGAIKTDAAKAILGMLAKVSRVPEDEPDSKWKFDDFSNENVPYSHLRTCFFVYKSPIHFVTPTQQSYLIDNIKT